MFTKIACFVLSIAVLGGLGYFLLNYKPPAEVPRAEAQPTEVRRAEVPPRKSTGCGVEDPRPGEVLYACSEEGSGVYAAKDYSGFRELVTAARAGDEFGWKELIRKGEIILLEEGTPLLCLEWNPVLGDVEMRVVEGAMMNMRVSVSNTWITRNKPLRSRGMPEADK
jgi:hypothetical protein